LENSDPNSATIELEAFLDDLSNWYVRRSRRRFWKSEHDQDKNTAYATLYHVLVKFTRILAPFLPFISETIYQNLVRSVYSDARESVHHTAWPQADHPRIDQHLLHQMSLARQIASLGLSARNSAGLKVRQPLAKVLVYTGENHTLDDEMVDIVKDELNVKDFEFVKEATDLVTYRIMPDNKLLGPRFGAQFPKVRAALEALDPIKVADSVSSGIKVSLEVDGQTVDLEPQEILVTTQPVEGLAVASDKFLTVAVDSTITPELHSEGLAREIVRRVQSMRKNAGFNIEDRITTYYNTEGDLAKVFQTWGEYFKSETLSTDLIPEAAPSGSYVEEHNVDEEEITIGVLKNK
jgi:isoleucyl-tRNA synthetase